MPKITFKEILDIDTVKEEDFTVIEMEEVKDDKLSSTVYEFARLSEDREVYNRILHEKVSIIVDGKVKSPEIWPWVYINKNTEIIISPILFGGKGGTLQMVIGAILIIAGVMYPPIMVAGVAMMAPIAVGMIMSGVGMMISSIAMMMFAPSLPSLPEVSGAESKTYSWSGIRSMARTGVPVPIIIGTHMSGGYIISLFTRPKGKDNYIYMLLLLGEGEVEGLSQADDVTSVCSTSLQTDGSYVDPAIYINNQLSRNFNGIRWWFRNGVNTEDGGSEHNPGSQNPIPNFNDVRVQYDEGREIDPEEDGGTIFTTQSEVDKVNLSLMCPGLYEVSEDGQSLLSWTIEYKVEYKEVDDPGAWTLYQHEIGRLSTLCEYAMIDDDLNITCAIGKGTATKDGCNNLTTLHRPCYKITRDFYKGNSILVGLDNTYISYEDTESNYATGSYRIDFVRVRLISKSFLLSSATSNFDDIEFVFEIRNSWGTSYNVTKVLGAINNDLLISKGDEESGEPDIWEPHHFYPDRLVIHGGGIAFTIMNPRGLPTYIETAIPHKYVSQWGFYTFNLTGVKKDYGVMLSNGTRNAVYNYVEIPFSSPGRYDIRISRKNKNSDDLFIADDFKLESVVEIINDQLIYPDSVLLGLEMKATGQLSGSPPNVTVIVKGLKVDVPDLKIVGVTQTFEDFWWNSSASQWEDIKSSVATWDGATLVNQYSENFATAIRFISLNERFGAGRDLSSGDFDFDSWAEYLKDCHINYIPLPEGYDYFNWWDYGSDAQFDAGIFVPINSYSSYISWGKRYYFVEKVVASRKIVSALNADIPVTPNYNKFPNLYFHITPEKVLDINHNYKFEITFNNQLTNNVFWQVIAVFPSGISVKVSDSATIVDNKLSVTFRAKSVYDKFEVLILGENSTSKFTGEITNISLKIDEYSCHFHSANGIMETSQSADTAFGELLHSSRAWLIAMGDKLYFKSNKDEVPSETIHDSNMLERTFEESSSPLSEIPYIIEAQFTDASKNWNMNTRSAIVPVVEANKTSRQQIGFKYITELSKIERELTLQANFLANLDSIASFNLSSEHLHAIAGDVIRLYHSLPDWGNGKSGRVVSFVDEVSITLDDAYAFDSTSTYSMLYHTSDNTVMSAVVSTSDTSTDTIALTAWPATDPFIGGAYLVGKQDEVTQKFRLLSIQRTKENNIQCIATKHVSSVYDAPTISIIQDRFLEEGILNDLSIEIVSFNVSSVSFQYDRGFQFKVVARGYPIDHFVIEISENWNGGYTQIYTMSDGATNGIWYAPPTLKGGKDKKYYFRIYGKNSAFTSKYGYAECFLNTDSPALQPPSGLWIKGEDLNSNEFTCRDLKLAWFPVNIQGCSYILEIYSGVSILAKFFGALYSPFSIGEEYQLVHAVLNSTTYTFTFSDNASSVGGPHSALLVRIATLSTSGWGTTQSNWSPWYTLKNPIPVDLGSISGSSIVDGVKFSWEHSSEEDHKCYSVRTKVESGSWSSWVEMTGNEYYYQLTASDVSTYGNNPVIYIEVKDKDLFNQVSETASAANLSAGTVSDDIFKFNASASGGSGNISSLFDGVKTSGGMDF